jgi:tRNA(Leu) C34 or U34 (ribose-2'-O)-methylase TrmL
VIRTADAAGADAVVLTEGSTDPHGGKFVRATAGSLWHLPVVSGAPLETTVSALRQAGLTVLATTGAGEHDLDELQDRDELSGPTAWLFGSEAAGLSDRALALADRTVRIPLHGAAESLNLATAAAVCLYASARAHRDSHARGEPVTSDVRTDRVRTDREGWALTVQDKAAYDELPTACSSPVPTGGSSCSTRLPSACSAPAPTPRWAATSARCCRSATPTATTGGTAPTRTTGC